MRTSPTSGLRPMHAHECQMYDEGDAHFPDAEIIDGEWYCAEWVPMPCTFDPDQPQDHRPDDMPEPGDRCKDCGWDLTWVGGNEWAATFPPESDDPTVITNEGAPVLWLPTDDHVITLAEQSYACGRSTSYVALVAAPATLDEDGGPDSDWWDDVPVGDGHPCGATEHAYYRRTIIAAPNHPDLVGRTHESEG